jgi:uncharacterized membrane protein YphA (DoxX/SURF4 family)
MDAGLLIARAVLGLLMAAHGSQKLFGWFGGHGLAGTAGFFETLGFPPGRLFAATASATEVVSGLLVATGLLGPIGPALTLAVMIVASSVHWAGGLFAMSNGIEMPLLYATGGTALALTGPGAYSLDTLLGLAPVWTPSLAWAALAVAVIGGAANVALRRPRLRREAAPGKHDRHVDRATRESASRRSRAAPEAPERAMGSRMSRKTASSVGFPHVAARVAAAALLLTAARPTAAAAQSQSQNVPQYQAAEKLVAQHLATFDELDYVVFTQQQWTRLHESHSKDVTVYWPDGHATHGIDKHIADLSAMFVYAPDTRIKVHTVKIGQGEWTAVIGIMEGTFTKPMPTGEGKFIQPTGKPYRITMCTVGHWKDGVMFEEYLFWDNLTYMKQLGVM